MRTIKLLLSTLLLLSTSAFAATTVSTFEYDVSFDARYSDSVGQDSACSVSRIEGKDLVIPVDGIVVLRVEAVGAGRWIDLEIPAAKLPLIDGDDFTIESTTGDMRLTYINGILSYDIADKNDDTVMFYKQNIADLEIDSNLLNVKNVDASQVSIKKNLFGRVKTTSLMNLKCSFL